MLSGWVGASSAIIKFPDHPSTLVAGGAGGGQEYCRVNLTIYQVNTFFWRRGFVFGQVYSSGAEFRKIRIEPPLKAEIFSRFTGAYYRGATQRCCTLKERQLGCTLEEGARRARAAPRKINPSLLHWKWNQPMPNLESLKHGLIIINHLMCILRYIRHEPPRGVEHGSCVILRKPCKPVCKLLINTYKLYKPCKPVCKLLINTYKLYKLYKP
jgi:hypothetical protein